MRTQRSIWTFLTQELYTALAVLISLVSTPLLLRWLGDQRFGAVEALMGLIGYMALLEFGMSDALSPLLASAVARRDWPLVRRTLAAGVRTYSEVAGITTIVGLGVLLLIPYIIHVGPRYVSDLRWAWVVCILGTPVCLLIPFRVLVQARQRGYQLNLLYIAQWAIVTTLSLILAWAGWGITGQSLALLLSGIFLYLVLALYARKQFPGILTWSSIRTPPDRQAHRQLFNLRAPSFVLSICGTVSLLSDNLIIAYLISPAMVVPFFVTQRAALLVGKELQGIGGSSWPALAELYSREQAQLFNARLVELTRLVSILAVGALIPIAVYNYYFVVSWVGASRYAGGVFTIVASVNALLTACFALWTMSITGTGHVREILPGMLVQTAINFAGSILFTYEFGLIGPMLGTCVAFLGISTWYLPNLMVRLFDTRRRDLFLALLQPIALGVPYAAATWLFGTTFGSADWISMGWQVALLAFGYLLVGWLVLLSRAERAQWTERARLAIPRLAY
jgi:O-antigen/teichoic acid export membrane protein